MSRKRTKNSQVEKIRRHLASGQSITQAEASEPPFNCWRLAAVIHVLRNEPFNMPILTRLIGSSGYGEYYLDRQSACYLDPLA